MPSPHRKKDMLKHADRELCPEHICLAPRSKYLGGYCLLNSRNLSFLLAGSKLCSLAGRFFGPLPLLILLQSRLHKAILRAHV